MNRRRYSQRRRGRRRSTPAIFTARFWTKKKIIIAASALAAVVLAVVLICVFAGAPKDPENVTDEQLLSMKFGSDILIEGVDVSGQVFSDAIEPVKQKADEMLSSLNLNYTIEKKKYTITAYEMGAIIDYPSVMKEAMFGGAGEYELKYEVNEEKIKSAVSGACSAHEVAAKDAEVSLDVTNDEKNLIVSASMVVSDEVVGKKVDNAALAKKIVAAVEKKQIDKAVKADVEEIQPKWTKQFLDDNMKLMGEYTTTFKDSAYGRRYNIWKMSGVVCGVVLMPGETWSINQAAGDRTTENGWKDAAGIKNGAYVDEPGGGICQVSSTLYNAILRSEVTVVDRSHHSWPLKYVPVGLDATISTGSPDFVISNPYDTPIVLAVRCDAGNEKYVRVRVYGPEMDYKLDFTSKVVKESEPEPAATTVDPSLSPDTSKEVSPRHNALTVEIYKQKLDKQTGEKLGEPELYTTEYYAAFRGTIAYGPEKTDEPEKSADGEDGTKKPDKTKATSTAKPTKTSKAQ